MAVGSALTPAPSTVRFPPQAPVEIGAHRHPGGDVDIGKGLHIDHAAAGHIGVDEVIARRYGRSRRFVGPEVVENGDTLGPQNRPGKRDVSGERPAGRNLRGPACRSRRSCPGRSPASGRPPSASTLTLLVGGPALAPATISEVGSALIVVASSVMTPEPAPVKSERTVTALAMSMASVAVQIERPAAGQVGVDEDVGRIDGHALGAERRPVQRCLGRA